MASMAQEPPCAGEETTPAGTAVTTMESAETRDSFSGSGGEILVSGLAMVSLSDVGGSVGAVEAGAEFREGKGEERIGVVTVWVEVDDAMGATVM